MTLLIIIGLLTWGVLFTVFACACSRRRKRLDYLDAIEAMQSFDAAERAERYVEAYWERVEEAGKHS